MITGSIVALVTPMIPGSLEVDWDGLKQLVEWHIEQGTEILLVVFLSLQEPEQIVPVRRLSGLEEPNKQVLMHAYW